MLKSTFAIVLCTILLMSCNKNDQFVKAKTIPTRIDSLTTNAEIEDYIGDSDSMYRKFTLQKVQDIICSGCDTITNLDSLANNLKINFSWQKADLDNNGYTDLLATGRNNTYVKFEDSFIHPQGFNAFILMNFGEGNIKTYDLTDGHFMSLTARIEYDSLQPFVMVYKPRLISKVKRYRHPETKSKLTFKFGNFIEYNPAVKKYDIEKIEYATTGCNGECPVFSIAINKEGNAVFVANYYNYTQPWQKGNLLTGTYKSTVKDDDLEELIDVLNYTDFPNLIDNYSVPWTCDQAGIIKITYDNGKTKTISDYGLQGTYGLRLLHSMFKELRTNQQWKWVSKDAPYNLLMKGE
ncbi:DUF6438 domain-containing protein [Flavobacterium psychrotrophum]|uniref:DUF6438 domain-containing protein n=1 Tax=Flavobacterium psychrotrophum TaxID=2294119 RepID=UPI0013C45EE0|nr:DUF6438 domain-containing protein [Flavobacterium psychrotrophum]